MTLMSVELAAHSSKLEAQSYPGPKGMELRDRSSVSPGVEGVGESGSWLGSGRVGRGLRRE